MKRVLLAGLAALFVGGMSIALHAWSQTPSADPGAAMAHHWGAPMPLPSERVEPMLAFAKTSLKITPAQEAAWNTVAEVVRKHAKAHDEDVKQMRARFEGARDEAKPPRPSGIEMLQHQQQRLAQRAKELDELLAAAKPLYASLSDDQKKAADRLLHHGGGMHGGPGRMGPH